MSECPASITVGACHHMPFSGSSAGVWITGGCPTAVKGRRNRGFWLWRVKILLADQTIAHVLLVSILFRGGFSRLHIRPVARNTRISESQAVTGAAGLRVRLHEGTGGFLNGLTNACRQTACVVAQCSGPSFAALRHVHVRANREAPAGQPPHQVYLPDALLVERPPGINVWILHLPGPVLEGQRALPDADPAARLQGARLGGRGAAVLDQS
mmetsp:Transcript_106866/g.312407  ORF Transcript_106866/g.312407 Transcript_106866/m.312407 type:complete len:212 (-) Transcript_106866:198-833(-)